jgi:hypothetical protein
MEITEDILRKIKTIGTLGYPVGKIINVLNIPANEEDWFIREFRNKDSEIRRWYQKGVDQSDFEVDQKLFELSRSGDLKAIELYNQRKSKYLRDNREY